VGLSLVRFFLVLPPSNICGILAVLSLLFSHLFRLDCCLLLLRQKYVTGNMPLAHNLDFFFPPRGKRNHCHVCKPPPEPFPCCPRFPSGFKTLAPDFCLNLRKVMGIVVSFSHKMISPATFPTGRRTLLTTNKAVRPLTE